MRDKGFLIRLLLAWIVIVIIACGLFILFLHFYVGVPWQALLSPEIVWR